MRLKELLNGIEILKSSISLEEEVEMPCSDSRKCTKNSVFVAINGLNRNGNNYIYEAQKNGAKCIVVDEEGAFLKHKNCILVKNSRKAISYMWSNYYNSPCSKLKIIGITGTNGKTSCAYFLYSILKGAGKSVGLISTVECRINDRKLNTNGGGEVLDIESAMTTPDPEALYHIFSKMRDEKVEFVVMEVSSHSLELCKAEPLNFCCAIFTNLSPEHLDFHKNMESYFNAKKKLFEKCQFAIVNSDDEYGRRLLAGNVCNFLSVSMVSNADFCAKNIEISNHGARYLLKYCQNELIVHAKISGRYTVYNSMLALACAINLGINADEVIKGIATLEFVPGRMEKVEEGIFIDYAHTPRAFENILSTAREINPKGRIIVLFGCGGDRDKSKRPKMGEIASKMADKIIVSSDNSRSEKKIDIIIDILKGIEGENFEVIPNRRDAIKRALQIKSKKDVLLLVGKGHEEYEIDSNGKHYFSEKDIVREALYDKDNSDNYI